MNNNFNEIIEEYESLRANFRDFTKSGVDTKDALLEYEFRFLDLKASTRVIHKKVASEYERRNDKNSTAIKYRIAVAISEGVYKNEKGELLYPKCSISQAEKFAAGSDAYKKFLEQRTFYKEAFINISDIREEITNYITLIRDRINR